MKTILLMFISVQLWRAQVDSKPASKPCGLGGQPWKKPGNNTQTKNITAAAVIPNRRFHPFYGSVVLKFAPTGPQSYGQMQRLGKTTMTTTTRVLMDNDCDYVNYYCMRGFYTGYICARTIYNTYETFTNYCELQYINCMEQYDLWTIAHMGVCYNISGYQTWAYYSYSVWDDQQLEEMYAMPSK